MPVSLNILRHLRRANHVEPDALHQLANWFPVTLLERQLAWQYVPERFIDPFFADTLQRQVPAQRRVCLTGLPLPDPLHKALHDLPFLAPSAFIFHTSRCGSTLLTQLLASLPQCIVLSEPPVLDAILRATAEEMGHAAQITLLHQVMLALGQRRHGETHFFIKLDCWHLPLLPVLRRAFPTTPFWFLYREPQAILASHQRQRGPQMVPGLIFPPSLPLPNATPPLAPGDLDGYCLQVLALLLHSALEHARHLTLLHYRQLPNVIQTLVLPRVGLEPTPAQIEAMQHRAGFHAKDGSKAFHGDTLPPLTPGCRHLLDTLVEPLYQQLEQQRQQQHQHQAAPQPVPVADCQPSILR